MYYDNKSTFYIKQYGPVFIVLLLSALLISGGIYIYMKSANSLKNVSAKATNQTVNSKEAQVDTNSKITDNTSIIPDDLDKLKVLQKSKNGYITNISNDGMLTAQIDKDKISFYLIGIDYSKSKADVFQQMTTDLEKRKIQIAFDNSKTEDSKIYAYLYVDNNILYNEEMLKNGLAILRVERNNTSLLDVLLEAEKTARVNFSGVWN